MDDTCPNVNCAGSKYMVSLKCGGAVTRHAVDFARPRGRRFCSGRTNMEKIGADRSLPLRDYATLIWNWYSFATFEALPDENVAAATKPNGVANPKLMPDRVVISVADTITPALVPL